MQHSAMNPFSVLHCLCLRRPALAIMGIFCLCLSFHAAADETVTVCYNYGCAAQEPVIYSEVQLREIRALLREARDAAGEREKISLAIGRLLGWAGKQTPISADRGGNYSDHGVRGRMDCIDHSTTTTRLLKMLEARGMLRWHRVLPPYQRLRFVIFQHYSAVIEEIVPAVAGNTLAANTANVANAAPGTRTDTGGIVAEPVAAEPGDRRFVVDSWYFDNGQPAAVFPLQEWLNGNEPDVIDE